MDWKRRTSEKTRTIIKDIVKLVECADVMMYPLEPTPIEPAPVPVDPVVPVDPAPVPVDPVVPVEPAVPVEPEPVPVDPTTPDGPFFGGSSNLIPSDKFTLTIEDIEVPFNISSQTDSNYTHIIETLKGNSQYQARFGVFIQNTTSKAYSLTLYSMDGGLYFESPNVISTKFIGYIKTETQVEGDDKESYTAYCTKDSTIIYTSV